MSFVLPPARKEFACKNKRQQGYGQCDQMIYKADDGLIKNVTDGRGGLKNTRHICPDRVGSEHHHYKPVNMLEYNYAQQNWCCSMCGTRYNAQIHCICPGCQRLECRSCQNLQNWIVGKGILCFKCGDKCDVRSIKYIEISDEV